MFKKLVPILLVFVFVLTACGGGPVATEAPAAEQPQAPAATEAPKPTEAPPAASKTVTFIWTQEFDTLNYLYSNMWFSSITLQLWNCSAWDFDENNNPQLVLAKEMPSGENGGISADGKVITIKLREDAVWSDGTPLTADDFIFTYKMTVDPANTVASQHPYDKIVSVEAPDKYTVVTTFAEPFAPWQTSIWKSILPAHVLQPVYDKDGNINSADWNRNPTVGCGPFVLDKWESGSFARFIVNEKYWLGRPKLDEIFIRFVPDDASQIAALKTGEGDLGTFISWSDVPDLEAAGIAILQANSGYNEGFYFNLGEKGHVGLKDVKVRQAIAYGIDRESIVKDLLLGGTPVTSTDWEKTAYADPIAALAEEVIAEQKAEVARRQVLFSVMPMPECVADAHMLKDVLTHLISNAIKFTAHRVPARIEVGATEQQGITCYFVRDNGAGFNMKYSGKLFGVFQRLHRVDEFDGIGIDLAIVQRIIQRHGGRIWAEAEVDNGATFFFTVPPDSINQS